MSIIWFIRHTQSQANAGERTIDPALIELTHLGKEQAIHIAEFFEQQPDIVVTSPYLRTRQTAQPLLDRLLNVPHEVWPVQEFTYLDYNRCRNTTVIERRPLVNEYWERNDPYYIDGERAESFASLLERVAQMWQKLRDEYDGKWVVIYSHAQFIRAALWYWLYADMKVSPQGMKSYRSFSFAIPIPNAAIIKLRYESEVWYSPVQIRHIPPHLITGSDRN